MNSPSIHKTNMPCLTLIGMPGVGKTTLASRLGERLGWAWMDSDKLIEALYGARLQDITDALGKDAFLDVEAEIIQTIQARRCVLATGGSVVYRDKAVRHLSKMGLICHIKLPLEQIVERVRHNPERGIAIAPGQTLEDLFRERDGLYRKAAHFACETDGKKPEECVDDIIEQLRHAGWAKYCPGI